MTPAGTARQPGTGPGRPVPYTLTPRAYALLGADGPDPAPALWQHVAAVVAWLDAANPRTDHEIACRVMKLAEETGEAVAAYLGMTGQNPRKGTCATRDDLAGELCDVIITAMIALATTTGDPAAAETRLQVHLSARSARLLARTAAGPGPGEWGCELCGAGFFGAPPEDGLCPPCRAAGGGQ